VTSSGYSPFNKAENESEGFKLHYGSEVFDDGDIIDIHVKYGVFGALIREK
jgi:hypothetical protein